MSFGFSTGDFIAALELVGTVIDALRDSGGASSEYREIVKQLYSLETALIRVKRLEVDPAQNAELVSLQQAAAQCQQTISDFWKKVQKYQPHLRSGGSSSRLKDGWMKIQWAVCKKEDVARFKADLVGHTESIQLLLMAMQMASTSLHEKRYDQKSRSLAGKVQDSYFGCLQRLSNIVESLQSGIEQGKKLLVMTTKVMQTNIKVFQVVLNIQRIITRIPGQIDRQQPVYFIDALGRSCPFHLEFVRSSEALVSVLMVNFTKVGHASEMIERGDFVIQDSATKKDVNLGMDWDLCFSPGQRVEMSMVFKRRTGPTNNCPTCKAECGKSTQQDIECQKCGLNFRRVVELENVPYNVSNINPTNAAPSSEKPPTTLGTSLPGNSLKRKRAGDQEEIDEVSLFRRVRIYNIHSMIRLGPARSDLDYRVTIREFLHGDWVTHGIGIAGFRLEIKTGRLTPILHVTSEVSGRILLQIHPTSKHGFQMRQDTLNIQLTNFGTALALKFQTHLECAEIWQCINDILEQETQRELLRPSWGSDGPSPLHNHNTSHSQVVLPQGLPDGEKYYEGHPVVDQAIYVNSEGLPLSVADQAKYHNIRCKHLGVPGDTNWNY